MLMQARIPMAIENGVLFQFFHWHYKNDGTLWREVAANAQELARTGITSVWLPPAYKGQAGTNDTGYGVYDLYDLGEFNQKKTVRTKYGSKDEFIEAVKAIQRHNMEVYADFVLNHRCGADETEIVKIVEVDKNDRTKVIPDSEHDAELWTKYTFPGRAGKYSQFIWNHQHFTAVDYKVEGDDANRLYLLAGKEFSNQVSDEHGNFDYLMGSDVDFSHPDVVTELRQWAKWFIDLTGINGLRLDAVKHIPASFYKDYVNFLRAHFGDRELLSIGEYWSNELDVLRAYIDQTEKTIQLFDVPLHYQMCQASKNGKTFDLRQIFDGTLVAVDPTMAVTFVDNHDTQPGQSLESWVEDWFKPMAYALILLRESGYPVVFYGDYYGCTEEHHQLTSHRKMIEVMLDARRRFNHGPQHDYLDHPTCIAWSRLGNENHPGQMVVILSTADVGTKRIKALRPNTRFRDLTLHQPEPIITNDTGEADFICPAGKVSVWVCD